MLLPPVTVAFCGFFFSCSTSRRSVGGRAALIIPIWTFSLPLESASAMMVPSESMLMTCTVSPTLKSDALWSDFTVLRFSSFILPRSLIFARSFCLSASIALASAFAGLVVHLLYFLMAASASAFASSMISDASWRAFARISAFLSESSVSFICARS